MNDSDGPAEGRRDVGQPESREFFFRATRGRMSGSAISPKSMSLSASGTSAREWPALFGAALALAIILPLLNFLRMQPLGDFYGEWSCAVGLTVATIAVARRLPQRAKCSWSTVAIPLPIAFVLLIHLGLNEYAYAADWLGWLGYLSVALMAIVLSQAMVWQGARDELLRRVAWAIAAAAVANFFLQVAQAARMDVQWAPYVVYRAESSICQLFGNVAQTNHANTLAWLGIVSIIYITSLQKLKAYLAAVLIGLLLLSSALTVSRMGWLFLAATVALLASRQLWPSIVNRSRVLLSVSLIVGFATATWASASIRENMAPECVSSVDRLVTVEEAGNQIRPVLWRQAVDVWQSSPWIGTGAGGFIGSVYRSDVGEGAQPLDSFAHNIVLQLLAEFGLIALIGVAAVVFVMLRQLCRHRMELTSEDGFAISGVTIIGIHSMLEFPLWYLHFLVITSLLLGALIQPKWTGAGVFAPVRAVLLGLALFVAAGSIAVFNDYRKLDRLYWISDFAQALGAERVPELQVTLEEAALDVRLFGPLRDYTLALGRPVDREDLAGKIQVVERVMSRMPNVNVIHLRILLAILDDDDDVARKHLRRAFKFHSQHSEALVGSMRARIAARPEEFAALGRILDEELARKPKRKW